MDKTSRPLAGDLAKRSNAFRRSSEIGKIIEETKGRRRVLPHHGFATSGLIIPRPRDRWFKSSPRNQFQTQSETAGFFVMYRVYVIENLQGRRYVGLSENTAVRLQQHNNGVSKWTKHRGP